MRMPARISGSTYRFLDLRRERIHRNILLRSRGDLQQSRRRMVEVGVHGVPDPDPDLELAPRGARDFLVPSRLHPGKFYGLAPRPPQQFKQLLMIAGLRPLFPDRAPASRDEDSRADRSPGEFYQLDFEDVLRDPGGCLRRHRGRYSTAVFEEFQGRSQAGADAFPAHRPYDEIDAEIRLRQA